MRLMTSLVLGLLVACGDKEAEDTAVEAEVTEETEAEDTAEEETEDSGEEEESTEQ